MTKRELKPEYQKGGSKRAEILEKAVRYLQDKRIMQTQADRQHFLINELGLSTSEYMSVLNKASGGALMESVWN
jgi:hypothetical protein